MRIALPTIHGGLFVLAAIISLAVAYVNVGLATALVAAVLTAIAVSSFIMAQFSLFGIELTRETMMDTTCNTNTTLPLRIANRSRFFRQGVVISEKSEMFPGGRLNIAVRPLRPRESLMIPRSVRLIHRGHFSLNRICVYGGDPAGIFRKTKIFHLPGDILVSPRVADIPSLTLRQNRKVMPGHDGRPLGIAGLGNDFFGIRPYRHGDEMRFVHWKSTAAKQHLMVMEMEASTVDRVAIVLDTSAPDIGIDEYENNFEFLISIAATITNYLSSIYCFLSFFANISEEQIADIHGDATGVKRRILSVLTELRPTETKFETLLSNALETMEPGTVLYVLSMSYSPKLVSALDLLSEHHVHIHWLYAPKINFPYIDAETPLVLTPAKIKIDKQRQNIPIVLSCQSRIEDVLN